MASGTAGAFKLLIAALAFMGAYAGVEASQNASVSARPAGSGTPVHTITLSAGPAVIAIEPPAEAGVVDVTVTSSANSASCDREIRVRTLLINPDPAGTLMYGWRLERWSDGAESWKTYLTSYAGFAGEREVAEWEPQVIDNPGRYRVELTTDGATGATEDPEDAESLLSHRFQITC